MANGRVTGTNPGQVLAWVNVTSTSGSFNSLVVNETLPMDWSVHPSWMPAKGGVSVFFLAPGGTFPGTDITNKTKIAVSSSNPEKVSLSITNIAATAAQHSLDQGDTVLLAAKISYMLKGTRQTASSYPRNYRDTATAAAWNSSGFTGSKFTGSTTAFFTAYAKVLGDVNGDFQVDLFDAAAVGRAFGSHPGDARWNANADFDNNNVIDILDVARVAYYYGTHA